MSLVNSIEFYGIAVANGDMAPAAAAQALSRDSQGGLTVLGAADLLLDPFSAGARYASIAEAARTALDRLNGEGESR